MKTNNNTDSDQKRRLMILNSIGRRKEEFKPIEEKHIKWYTCGPTVYDVAHLGHARCYITFDIIRRILQDYFGYKINYVMNITDIDDKIIKRALLNQQHNSSHQTTNNDTTTTNNLDHKIFKDLTTKYENEFHDDMSKLNVLPPSALTRVTEFIPQIGDFIKRLEDNGFAYRSPSGSVYFDTSKFNTDPKHRYAKLLPEGVGQSEAIEEGEGELFLSSQATQQEKKCANDFALWKQSKAGEPSWTTHDYVPGRPGWHIECSVMATHLLGENIDIHSGGCDLKFPHHDNEIAQSEAYFNTGNDWINYFIHAGHLTISGCKMSKSLKNFITIREALKDHTSRQIRFAFLAHGWTETLDYSENTLNIAKTYEKTFTEFFLNISNQLIRYVVNHQQQQQVDQVKKESPLCNNSTKTSDDQHLKQSFEETIIKIDAALSDNFDTRTALNCLVGLTKEYNKTSHCDMMLIRDVVLFVDRILNVFGTSFDEFNMRRLFNILINPDQELKLAKLFKCADAIARFRFDVRKTAKSADLHQQSIDKISTICDVFKVENLPKLGIQLTEKEDKHFHVAIDPETSVKGHDDNSSTNIEIDRKLSNCVDAIARFRLDVMKAAESVDPKESIKKILILCDALRDEISPNLGIRLEDREEEQDKEETEQRYVIKLVVFGDLTKERNDKEQAKRLKEETSRLEKLKLIEEREKKMRMPPNEMFLNQKDKYSKFDDKGLPTHDNLGKEISKSALKKLQRLYADQETRYNKYMSHTSK